MHMYQCCCTVGKDAQAMEEKYTLQIKAYAPTSGPVLDGLELDGEPDPESVPDSPAAVDSTAGSKESKTSQLPARQKQPSFRRFRVALVKVDGAKIGLDIRRQEPGTLVITSIKAGLVETWNARHPDYEVKVGDMIIQVNDHRTSPDGLLDIIAKSRILNLVLLRAI
mmetsp:Transcript_34064/g.77683  ORF Transcript_34064/g.77683 Transcript_34064/m.77683 type:complete len:167 (-) Transcript_34064:39-539(-)